MKVRIKRIDTSLPMPDYQSEGAAGFDMYSRIDAVVPPRSDVFLPSNLVVETPEGYMLIIAARGSLFKKKKLILANSVGIVDYDFRGDEDEMLLQVYNVTDEPVTITRGERIAQGIFIKFEKGEWQEVNVMGNKNRGSHGSTDER